MDARRQKLRVRQSSMRFVRLHRRPVDVSPPSPQGIKMSDSICTMSAFAGNNPNPSHTLRERRSRANKNLK